MKFRSEQQRKAHPQAGLIPDSLWRDDETFSCELPDFLLPLMQAEEGRLTELAQDFFYKKEKIAYLAMVLSHPHLNHGLLYELAQHMGLSDSALLAVVVKLKKTSFVDYLLARISDAVVQEAVCNDVTFAWAVTNGHLDVIERLIQIVPDRVQTMIAADGFGVFRNAAINGHLDIMKRLMQLASHTMMEIITFYDFSIFRLAAENGHLDVIEYLMQLAPNTVQDMIAAEDFFAFRWAAAHGHLDVMERLMQLAPDRVEAMIAADGFYAFCEAAANGHLDVMDHLIQLAPDRVQAMITAGYFDAFRCAARMHHQDAVNRLLEFPKVFAYAELHEREYGQYVSSFIENRLITLHAQKNQAEQDNPNAVFDVIDAQARLLFYVARHLIRRNDPANQDELLFLLDIPAVKALAHAEVTARRPNELFRLALATSNQGAAELLLALPGVRVLAEQNDYYRDEIIGGLDLAILAQDRESSMHALSTGEQRRLQAALDHYKPLIEQAGVSNLMDDLRKKLEARYKENPAVVTSYTTEGETVKFTLPLHWSEFQALPLAPADKEEALKAYYQHKDHTAWRYLSKPNFWMHKHASYVYVSEEDRTQRWSTFEEYQSLIAMLFVAVTDANAPLIDGYTLNSRLEQFIDELGHIGRAHNFDKSWIKTDKDGATVFDKEGKPITEERDDQEGDRPSCFSGVRRRLLQAVQGHHLFKILTQEVVKEEIRDFVWQYFNDAINEGNRTALKQAWDKHIAGDDLGEQDWCILKSLDISHEQQSRFIQGLGKKYLEQFEEEDAFTKQVERAFGLKGSHDAHILNFDHFGVARLLERPTPSVALLTGIGTFKPSTAGAIQQGNEADNTKGLSKK